MVLTSIHICICIYLNVLGYVYALHFNNASGWLFRHVFNILEPLNQQQFVWRGNRTSSDDGLAYCTIYDMKERKEWTGWNEKEKCVKKYNRNKYNTEKGKRTERIKDSTGKMKQWLTLSWPRATLCVDYMYVYSLSM